jgi:PAS domain S-box-containing protein
MSQSTEYQDRLAALTLADRVAAVHGYAVLDTPPEPDFDDVAALAARVCGAAGALVTLVDDKRQFFKAAVGLQDPGPGGIRETPLSQGFCPTVAATGQPLVVPDLSIDPRFRDDPAVTGPNRLRLYAGVPLVTPAGHVVGALCVTDRNPIQPSPEQMSALGTLARQVVTMLELRRHAVERRAAADATEDRFRAAFDQASIGMVELDLAGVIVRANPAFCRLVGRPESDVVGGTSREYTLAEDQPRDTESLAGLVAGRDDQFAYEKRYVRPDGSTAWARVNAAAVRAVGGAITGVIATAEDVTDRRIAEDRLRASEERFALAVASAGLGTFHWDLPVTPATVYDWNATLKGFFWQPPDAVVGPELRRRMVHPDDRERVGIGLDRAIRQGVRYDEEYRIVGPAGQVRWVRAIGQATGGDPPTRFGGIVLDVTEARAAADALRHSEALFRQLADAMPQIVFSAAPDGHVDYFNRRWYEYTGLPAGGVGYEHWRHVLTEEGLRRVAEAWPAALATATPYEIEYQLRRHDGQLRWHLGRALPVLDADRRVVRWFGTNTDVHDVRTLSEQNAALLDSERSARAEAERQGRVKDEFLATLSHELRTPLNAILGWAQILNGDLTDGRVPDRSELADALGTIERNARSQRQIIEDLLDMSRVIAGTLRMDVQRVDLPAVIRSAIDTVAPAAAAKSVAVTTSLDPRVGPVSGDPNRLQQVLWNLLSNAVKFTPRGGRVAVALVRVDGHVEVSVGDTGEGIDADFLPFVFDRFRQADSSSTRRHGGLGLGLAIVKQLVELHGGTVRVGSPGPGRGTTFTVALPVPAVPPPAKPGSSTPLAVSTVGPTRGHPRKLDGVSVLVVDDDPDARLLVTRILTESGADVRTAGSAADAAGQFVERPPTVLVSDIGMPGEDGHALIRRLRAMPVGRDVPAVALTAYARATDRVKALEAGYQMHAVKPVEPAELIAIVASLAGRMGR